MESKVRLIRYRNGWWLDVDVAKGASGSAFSGCICLLDATGSVYNKSAMRWEGREPLPSGAQVVDLLTVVEKLNGTT